MSSGKGARDKLQPSASEPEQPMDVTEEPTSEGDGDKNKGDTKDAGYKAVAKEGYIMLYATAVTNFSVIRWDFIVKPTTPLGRITNFYIYKLGFDVNTTRFLFDGQDIEDADTAESLNMKCCDHIVVLSTTIGAYGRLLPCTVPRQQISKNDGNKNKRNVKDAGYKDIRCKDAVAKEDKIFYLYAVTNIRDIITRKFKVKSTTPLEGLKNFYIKQLGFDVNTTRFVFKEQDVKDADTVESLNMKSGDTIVVLF